MSDNVPLQQQQVSAESLVQPLRDLTVEDKVRSGGSSIMTQIEKDYGALKSFLENPMMYGISAAPYLRNVRKEMRKESVRQEIPAPVWEALFEETEGGRLKERTPRSDDTLNELVKFCDDVRSFLVQCCVKEPISTRVEYAPDQAKRLNEAFHRTYVGDAADVFVRSLQVYADLYPTDNYYGRIIPIVQGSGTGKSRMIEELKRKFPTMNVVFRGGSHPTLGWPPRDVSKSFFDNIDESFMAEEKAAAFLGAWADVMCDTAPDTAKSTDQATLDDWMKSWDMDKPAEPESSARSKRFEDIKKRTVDLLASHESPLAEVRRAMKEYHKEKNGKDDRDKGKKAEVEGFEGEKMTYDTWHRKLYRLLTQRSFRKLGERTKELKFNKVLFALDECTELNGTSSRNLANEREPRPEISLIAFQRIMKAADTENVPKGVTFWFALLDTNSSIVELAGTGAAASSFRLTNEYKPLPIWCYLGFDQMCKLVDLERPIDALFIVFLLMYGRPYWSTLDGSINAVWAAIKKLLYTDKFKPEDLNQVFAVFSQRVLLDLAGNNQSSRLAIESLRRHMRLLITVVNGIALTDAPSEPMLALAAAVTLNQNRANYDKALETLIKEITMQGGVLEKGRHGELCGRLLLTVARDKATPETRDGNEFVYDSENGLPRVQPVSLSKFLQTLLGDDLGVSHVSQLVSDLLKDGENIWVNFTHFVQAPRDMSVISPEDLYDLWCSGGALQCTFLQPVIDVLIPDYRGNLYEPFDKKKLGYTVIQIKEVNTAVSKSLFHGLAGPIIEIGTEMYKPKNYVALIMDLTAPTTTKSGMPKTRTNDLIFGIPAKPDKTNSKWPGYMKANEQERYCLNVQGHTGEVYPIVEQLPAFRQLFRFIAESRPLREAEDYMAQQMDRFTVLRKLRDKPGRIEKVTFDSEPERR